MRRFLSIVLIIIGLAIIAYPQLRQAYFTYRQKQLLAALGPSWGRLDAREDQEVHRNFAWDLPLKGEVSDDYRSQYVKDHTEGILHIEKIDLHLPILKGATKTNLNISAASVEGSGRPGQVGNYCISAHRGRSYGLLFNRLHELAAGDIIKIIERDHSHTYRVFEKLMLETEDTWVLLPREGQKLLTLVTCDYSRRPYPRLVVRAKLIAAQPQ